MTHVKLRILYSGWYQDLCEEHDDAPAFQQILADRLGESRKYVSQILNGKLISRPMQDRIANEVCISVGELFGDDAWFRVSAVKLKAKQDARELVAC